MQKNFLFKKGKIDCFKLSYRPLYELLDEISAKECDEIWISQIKNND